MFPETLLEQIKQLHAGPDRGYHGWSHPLALLRLFAEIEPLLHDPLAVRCAILLHDAIYDPRSTDNEQRSAALAAELLKGVVPDETLARTLRMIEATARHMVPAGLPAAEADDMAHFLDMDLSILGARNDIFDRYEGGVRYEYRAIPDPAFRQGRAAILEKFLARDALYFSDWGRAKFEAKARQNLTRSIAQLTDQKPHPEPPTPR